MGGGGSMAAANQSLKNNRSLLKKDGYGKWTKLGKNKKRLKRPGSKEFKALTEEKKEAIRTKIRRETLRTNIKIWISLAVVVGLLVLLFTWLIE